MFRYPFNSYIVLVCLYLRLFGRLTKKVFDQVIVIANSEFIPIFGLEGNCMLYFLLQLRNVSENIRFRLI